MCGHITRRTDERWEPKFLEWQLRLGKRSVGSPLTTLTAESESRRFLTVQAANKTVKATMHAGSSLQEAFTQQ